MTRNAAAASEAERDRAAEAADLATDQGPGWADDFRPGTHGCHELLDRAGLFAAMLDRDLLRHPACVANPDWFALAAEAVDALHALYQRVGAEHLADD